MDPCDTIKSSKPCLPTQIVVGETKFSSENTALFYPFFAMSKLYLFIQDHECWILFIIEH